MPRPINPYDQRLLRNQAAISRRILQQYETGLQSLTPVLPSIKYKGKLFRLADYPQLEKQVNALMKKLQSQVYSTVVNSIKESWDLSNRKNNVLVDKRLAGKQVKKKVRQALYDPNNSALKSFIDRKEKGLNLSQRIWKGIQPIKAQIEQTVGMGIGKGQPATSIARDLKQYLQQPDKLFRRVQGEDGKLHLSKSARNYNPGQGVYRSSYKNAMRVARTETNGAYRSADYERWQKLPFVTGIKVQLSNAHPKYDICDKLVGLYPKDFKFQGWHPQCICFATPEMMSDEEYDRMEAQILNGERINTSSANTIRQPPAAFGKYLQDNKKMLEGFNNKPYWMRDNPQYLPMDKK